MPCLVSFFFFPRRDSNPRGDVNLRLCVPSVGRWREADRSRLIPPVLVVGHQLRPQRVAVESGVKVQRHCHPPVIRFERGSSNCKPLAAPLPRDGPPSVAVPNRPTSRSDVRHVPKQRQPLTTSITMGDFGPGRDKWVCPNDRELSLRAKLKTGWSVKTGSLSSFGKPEQLNDVEQEAIMNVIRKAEQLERVEQERVGRLVERLENMKRNAIGNGTTQCILCGDEFGLLGASPLLCSDCKKAVCTKCGVDTFSAQKDPLWLCKICAETREMWKKSGAWFFKSLPKYVLPEKKAPEASKYGKAYGRSYNTWCQAKRGGELQEHAESTDSSDEDGMRMGMRSQAKQKTSSESVESSDSAGSVVPPPSPSRHSPKRLHSRTNEAALSYEAESHVDYQEGKEDSPSADELDDSRAAFQPYARQDSERSVMSSVGPREQDSTADEASSFDRSPDDSSTSLGALEFSLLYDPINQALHCTVLRAKGLRPMDYNGLSDPYVRLQLVPSSSKLCKMRTRTVHKTVNPEFNETVTFHGVSDLDVDKRLLRLSVVDEDVFGHDFIGETRVPLKTLRPHQTRHFNVYLEHPHALGDQKDLGRILLSLMYSSERHILFVGIIRCNNLLARDANGFSDPFVRIQMKPDPMRRRYKTSTKKKTLDPEYNEEFAFDVRPQDVGKRTLEITVWDKDYGKADDYLGGLRLGIHSKGERLRHWLDAVGNPGRYIERWHLLSDALLLD